MAQFISGLEFGGSGPKRLTGTSAVVGNFYCLKARGEDNLVINTLDIGGVNTTEWNGAVITPGDGIFFGNKIVTRVVLTSGEGEGYQP